MKLKPATLALERRSGLSCENRSDFHPSFHLTTGTFNLVVKDRIAFRLSGAFSVQSKGTPMRLRLSSKPYKGTSSARPLSTPVATLDFHQFLHISSGLSALRSQPKPQANEPVRQNPAWHSKRKREISFSAHDRTHLPPARRSFFAHAEVEDTRLRKDLWRFLRLTPKPFEELCPRIQSRGRDHLFQTS